MATSNPTGFNQQLAAIKIDPASSYWIKGAVDALLRRDPVDALCDVQALLALCQARVEWAHRTRAPYTVALRNGRG